jgi:hypothetical protein
MHRENSSRSKNLVKIHLQTLANVDSQLTASGHLLMTNNSTGTAAVSLNSKGLLASAKAFAMSNACTMNSE